LAPPARASWVARDLVLVETTWIDVVLQIALALALVVLAHGPILAPSVGLLGGDRPELPGLGALTPAVLRRLALAAVVLGALGAGALARRALAPWFGDEHARAAGYAGALLCALHPFAGAALASSAGALDALSFALATWASVAFLAGRQARSTGRVALALLPVALAGALTARGAWAPLALALLEFVAAHRHRPLLTRLRTSATTALVFGACALLPRVLLHGMGGIPVAAPGVAEALRQPAATAAHALASLGLVIQPVNLDVLGAGGAVLAGALLLVALHPGLLAARSAPRLWGRALVAFTLAMGLAALVHADVRFGPHDLTRSAAGLASSTVVALALACASTARIGRRRAVLPWAVAVGTAVLAHGSSVGFVRAVAAAEELRLDIVSARERYGRTARVLVLDAPRSVAGVDPFAAPLHALCDESPEDVLGLSTPAFLALIGTSELERLRARPIVLVLEASTLGDPAARGRISLELPPREPSGPPAAWSWRELRSPDLDLETLSIGACVVESSAPSAARLRWRAVDRPIPDGRCAGVWIARGERRVGIFDLGSSLTWRLSNRVRRMWLEEGGAVERAEVRAELDALGNVPAPRLAGRTWSLSVPNASVVRDTTGRGTFVLGLLARDPAAGGYAWREIPLARGRDERLVAPVESASDTSALCAWSLEYRLDGAAIARSRGEFPAADPPSRQPSLDQPALERR
jgi:hypothetical protein